MGFHRIGRQWIRLSYPIRSKKKHPPEDKEGASSFLTMIHSFEGIAFDQAFSLFLNVCDRDGEFYHCTSGMSNEFFPCLSDHTAGVRHAIVFA